MTLTWSLAGSLKQGRYGHGVIFDGVQFLVIGGAGNMKTEVCSLNGKTITCTLQENGLIDYAYYPELFLVDNSYGNDC